MIRQVTRALWTGGVLRPAGPLRLARAVSAGRAHGMTPAATLAVAAALEPHATAVIDDEGTVTWAQLDALASSLAAAHGSEHPMAIMCRNHRGALAAIAAAARAGSDALLLSTELSAGQLQEVLRRHMPATVVHDAEFTDRLPARGIVIDDFAAGPHEPLPPPARRGRIVILTSGTTGTPKAAARDLPRRAMAGPLVAMIEDFGLRRREPVLIGPPLYHGFGLAFASVAQAVRAPVILSRRFDPQAALDAIATHRAGCMVGVPVMLDRMLAARAGDVSSLRAVVSAGAPLPPALATRFMDAFGDRLYNAYGSTETGFGAYATPADLRAAPGTIGRPPLGTTLQVLDAQRRPVTPGTTGSIFIGGELVIDGYVGGGSKERAGALMNTGDLGHADTEGRLFIDGREDDMIVSGGENVFPQEVEDVLAEHPGVADVAVLGVPDEEFGQRLRAYVVAAAPSPTAEALIAHVRDRLERFKVPREVVFCAEIPRNATGKTLRRVLAEAP